MAIFFVAYLAGVLTIATPCIFPVLPFVLARSDEPFRRGALPMLLGLAVSFAAVASLAAAAGGWAVETNRYGRTVALLVMTVFGLTMLLPGLATRMTAPLVSVGSRLSDWAARRAEANGKTAALALLLGIATGFLWAPCAGPVLGLILTGAALRGPNLETSLLLLAYGLGAATSLAASMLAGGRLFGTVRRSTRWGDAPRRMLGAAVVAGVAAIWLGYDTGTLTRWSSATASSVERNLIAAMSQEPGSIVRTAHAAAALELSAPLASLLGVEQWLNAPPPRPEDLHGKIVLVNFWTYSCINCLRALPHVRNWAQRYRDRGLVVIGVHTPEFAFEKDAANVAKALASLGVGYPVAIDNDFRIWRAFDNQAWPALYIIGADGRIRQRALGEGRYDELQRLIQRLLPEGDGTPATSDMAAIVGKGPQAPADERNLRSGESYVGYSQTTGFVSPGGIRQDVPSLYRSASKPPLNHWSLAGIWTIGSEFATLGGASGSITCRFHARDLHLVLAPASPGQSVRFRVKLDGAPPGSDHGSDVDADGWGTVQDGRLYQLIRQSGPVGDRTFEIDFLGTGVRAYSFTFG